MTDAVRTTVLAGLLAGSLTGCGLPPSGQTVTAYDPGCGSLLMPAEPECLAGPPFAERDQRIACQQSLTGYIGALDQYYICADRRLEEIFNGLVRESVKRVDCFNVYYQTRETGDPGAVCPAVGIPAYPVQHQADGLSPAFGLPACVRPVGEGGTAPRNLAELTACRDAVADFQRKEKPGSAQEQYNTFVLNLRAETDRRVEAANARFACLSAGRDDCR